MDDNLKAELNDVLLRPKVRKALKSKNFSAVKIIVGTLLNQAESVKSKPISIRSFSDENDHFLLELAVASKAAAIVTGDQEVLKAKRVRGIAIVDPREFCEKFKVK